MDDTIIIKAIQIIHGNDTTNYLVNKKLIEHLIKDKTDYLPWLVAILPVLAALGTLALTKYYESKSEKKKERKELRKELRKPKIDYFTFLVRLKSEFDAYTPLEENNFSSQSDQIADRCNSKKDLFYNLNYYGKIIFNGNQELIQINEKLFSDSLKIQSNSCIGDDENYNPADRHPQESLELAEEI